MKPNQPILTVAMLFIVMNAWAAGSIMKPSLSHTSRNYGFSPEFRSLLQVHSSSSMMHAHSDLSLSKKMALQQLNQMVIHADFAGRISSAQEPDFFEVPVKVGMLLTLFIGIFWIGWIRWRKQTIAIIPVRSR